jgi:hypothetical protein
MTANNVSTRENAALGHSANFIENKLHSAFQ